MIVIGAMFICAGCGEPKLDTSSDQTFSASLEKIYNSIPESDREAFRDYLYVAMGDQVPASLGGMRRVRSLDDIKKMYSLVKAMGNDNDIKLLNNINGLTKTKIIAKGKALVKMGLEERLANINVKIEETGKKVKETKNDTEIEKNAQNLERFIKEKEQIESELSNIK